MSPYHVYPASHERVTMDPGVVWEDLDFEPLVKSLAQLHDFLSKASGVPLTVHNQRMLVLSHYLPWLSRSSFAMGGKRKAHVLPYDGFLGHLRQGPRVRKNASRVTWMASYQHPRWSQGFDHHPFDRNSDQRLSKDQCRVRLSRVSPRSHPVLLDSFAEPALRSGHRLSVFGRHDGFLSKDAGHPKYPGEPVFSLSPWTEPVYREEPARLTEWMDQWDSEGREVRMTHVDGMDGESMVGVSPSPLLSRPSDDGSDSSHLSGSNEDSMILHFERSEHVHRAIRERKDLLQSLGSLDGHMESHPWLRDLDGSLVRSQLDMLSRPKGKRFYHPRKGPYRVSVDFWYGRILRVDVKEGSADSWKSDLAKEREKKRSTWTWTKSHRGYVAHPKVTIHVLSDGSMMVLLQRWVYHVNQSFDQDLQRRPLLRPGGVHREAFSWVAGWLAAHRVHTFYPEQVTWSSQSCDREAFRDFAKRSHTPEIRLDRDPMPSFFAPLARYRLALTPAVETIPLNLQYWYLQQNRLPSDRKEGGVCEPYRLDRMKTWRSVLEHTRRPPFSFPKILVTSPSSRLSSPSRSRQENEKKEWREEEERGSST